MNDTKLSTEKLLTAKAVGEMLSLSKRQIFRMKSAGLICPCLRVGAGAIRWRKSDIEQWISMGCPNKAMATTSEAPKAMASHNNLNQNYPAPSALSSQKSLLEKLATELIAIWIYCHSPILCQTEYNQALRLFESTLRKYLAVKNFDS